MTDCTEKNLVFNIIYMHNFYPFYKLTKKNLEFYSIFSKHCLAYKKN